MKQKKIFLIILSVCLLTALVLTACTPASPSPSPEEKPQGATPSEPDVEPTSPEPDADNLLCNQNAKANTALLPRGVKKDSELVSNAKGNYTLYYGATFDEFSYSDGKKTVSETDWFRQMGREYGITVRAVRKPSATVLSAERLAVLSGQALDLMSFTPEQLPFAVGLTEEQSGFVTEERLETYDFLNTTLLTFGSKGIRFFTPAGVARNLWYDATDSLTWDTLAPQVLAQNGEWDMSAFTAFIKQHTAADSKTVDRYGLEIRDFADLFASVGTPVIRYDEKFTSGAETIGTVLPQLQQFAAGNGRVYDGSAKKNVPSLANGTLFCRYGQTPFVDPAEKYPDFSWAPLPSNSEGKDAGTVSAVAPLLALPKGSHDKGAVCAALLWAARFADASHDTLRFTYGMKFEDWCAYYETTRQSVTVTPTLGSATAKELIRLVNSADTDLTELKLLVQADCARLNERLTA